MNMKNKALRLTALFLTLVMFVSLFTFNVMAEDISSKYPTGALPEDPNSIFDFRIMGCLNTYGDFDEDNIISISDAKSILKSVVYNDQNPDKDLNNDGRVSILDARQILRVVVKLDTFRIKAELKVGEVYETGTAYDKEPCKWTCNISPKVGLIGIKKYSYPSTPPLYEYNFTATVPGEYEAVLKYENSTTHEVLREITYNFTVTE